MCLLVCDELLTIQSICIENLNNDRRDAWYFARESLPNALSFSATSTFSLKLFAFFSLTYLERAYCCHLIGSNERICMCVWNILSLSSQWAYTFGCCWHSINRNIDALLWMAQTNLSRVFVSSSVLFSIYISVSFLLLLLFLFPFF